MTRFFIFIIYLTAIAIGLPAKANDSHPAGQTGDQFVPSPKTLYEYLQEGYKVLQVLDQSTQVGDNNTPVTVYYIEKGSDFAYCSDLELSVQPSIHYYNCRDLINSNTLADVPPANSSP